MLHDYSKVGWDRMVVDSSTIRRLIGREGSIRLITPGIGLSDSFQASVTIAAMRDYYNIDIYLQTYQPDLFHGNPKCTIVPVGGTGLILNSWSPGRLPPTHMNMNLMTQWNYQVGLWDVPGYRRCEFYPTDVELEYWEVQMNSLRPYVVIQTEASPPRWTYNNMGDVPSSRSEDRARTSAQVDWPLGRWTEVVDRMVRMGYNVVQVGAGHEMWIEGATPLTDIGSRATMLVMKYADLAVVQLSYPMFAANAMGIPSLVFYSGSYTRGYEVLDGVEMIDMTAEVECAPCPIDDSKSWCPGECMSRIAVDYVVGRIEEALSGSTNS